MCVKKTVPLSPGAHNEGKQLNSMVILVIISFYYAMFHLHKHTTNQNMTGCTTAG